MAGAALTALAVVATVLAGGFGGVQHDLRAGTSPVAATGPLAGQLIYTARTANDAAITLPGMVQNDLLQAGEAHQAIEFTQVGYTGNVSTSYVDMTPRTGNSSQDPVLKVPGRAVPAIDAKISQIETDINTPAGSGGGRALFAGLTRTDFTGVPVTIVSSGLDLADPDDFRSLAWKVRPAEVAAAVKQAGALPALSGPVTFVLVPVAGQQAQLEQSQKDYLKAVWTALLKAAGATSVTFTTASTTAGSVAPSAPAVPLPKLPGTPILQVKARNGGVTCSVTDSYFVFNSARLIDPATTIHDLRPCATAALRVDATFTLDGWTSYEGPLNADGTPAIDDSGNRTLSRARVRAIASLLVNDLGVPRSAITRETGHGNVGQPYADPRSAANRVVIITYKTTQ